MYKNTTQMMKLTYMLQNKDGRGQRVPRGQSWQWIHAVQDLDQLTSVLQWLAQRVHVDAIDHGHVLFGELVNREAEARMRRARSAPFPAPATR